MGSIKRLDESGMIDRCSYNAGPTDNALWQAFLDADKYLVEAEKIVAECDIPGIVSPGYVSRANEMATEADNFNLLRTYPEKLVRGIETVDKSFADSILEVCNELSTIKIDDIQVKNDFNVEITQYYEWQDGTTQETFVKENLTLGDFLGHLDGLSTQESTYVKGFTDVIYSDEIKNGKTLQDVVDEHNKEIYDSLYGADFDVKLYHPCRDILSDVLDTATLGTFALYKSFTGYDPITGENLTDQESFQEGMSGLVALVSFGYGCATVKCGGEILVSYVADVAGTAVGGMTYQGIIANGGSDKTARIAGLATSTLTGLAFTHGGKSLTEIYSNNRERVDAAADMLEDVTKNADDAADVAEEILETSSITEILEKEIFNNDSYLDDIGRFYEEDVFGQYYDDWPEYEAYLEDLKTYENEVSQLWESKGGKNSGFKYNHNPSDNQKVLLDALEDSSAVYGYSPNPASESIGGYANGMGDIDWSDSAKVSTYQARRESYHLKNDNIDELVINMRKEGYSTEEIARAANAQRNQNRLDDYIINNDMEGLERVKCRNIAKYGNEYGLTAEDALKKYGSWDAVIEKTKSANPAMDACCGLYDKYYHLYEVEK